MGGRLKNYLRKYPALVRAYHTIQRRFNINSLGPPSALEKLKREKTSSALAEFNNFLNSGRTLDFPRFEPPLISVVIVVFNRAELTFACLSSLIQNADAACEVIVIDNCSSDKTAELFATVKGITYVRNSENRHFLLASNQGAALAKGRYLLFLNNDAQLLPGALSAALQTLSALPEVGAVGAKLILPDNSLQEAGSLVWNDGTCLGYGRGDNPFYCQYMHRREVDFCSGAFLLTPKEMFDRLAGFDPVYQPAYYEDADYCLRLRKAGFKTIYEPKVLVRHFEFASSKAEPQALAMQLERRKIFTARHKEYLEDCYPYSPENIIFARQLPRPQKRLLFIDERLPHPVSGAGYPRANQIVRAALRAKWFVSIYPALFVEAYEDWETIYRDIPPEAEVLALAPYGPGKLKKLLAERQGYYQAIMVSRPAAMRQVQALLKKHPAWFEGVKLIYDAEAIFSLREKKYAELSGKPLSQEDYQSKLGQELLLARAAHTITTVCEKEAENFRQNGFGAVQILGHAVDAPGSGVPFNERRDVLFLGAIYHDSDPNADSVFWFIEEVLPHLRELGFKDEFLIAGTNQSARLRAGKFGGVRVVGPVDDPACVYVKARIFVAPTRFSAGIPLKVIEAAAHGLPVVASALAASQLDWQDGVQIMAAGDAAEFAQKCFLLYSRQELWQKISNAALARVREEYSPENLSRQLAAVLE